MRTKLLNSGVYKEFNKIVDFVKKQPLAKSKAIKASAGPRKDKLKVSKKK